MQWSQRAHERGIDLAIERAVNRFHVDWLHGSDRWSSPRRALAEQLRYLRQFGNGGAVYFRDLLDAQDLYPMKVA